MAEKLLIGDVTALTGIAAGRIRHYEKVGLLRADHLGNGYRVFDVDQVLDLLRIDLLRSLGVGIKDIARLLDGGHTTLANLLERQRALLVGERTRLDQLITEIDAATATKQRAADGDISEQILRQLATSHRHSIGVIGRLSEPLSVRAAMVYAEIFNAWELPVPSLFGQMALPSAAGTMLEELAEMPERAELFDRLGALAAQVSALNDDDEADQLARIWVDQQCENPLPLNVIRALSCAQPVLAQNAVIAQGFRTWAASITPAARRFVDEVSRLAAQRNLVALSVIVFRPAVADSVHRRASLC